MEDAIKYIEILPTENHHLPTFAALFLNDKLLLTNDKFSPTRYENKTKILEEHGENLAEAMKIGFLSAKIYSDEYLEHDEFGLDELDLFVNLSDNPEEYLPPVKDVIDLLDEWCSSPYHTDIASEELAESNVTADPAQALDEMTANDIMDYLCDRGDLIEYIGFWRDDVSEKLSDKGYSTTEMDLMEFQRGLYNWMGTRESFQDFGIQCAMSYL